MILALVLLALLGCATDYEMPEWSDFARPVSLFTGCPDLELPNRPAPTPEPPEWEVGSVQRFHAIARFSTCTAESALGPGLSLIDDGVDQDVDRDKFE